MTDGSSPVRKNKSVGSDEVNDARPERLTGSLLSSETLKPPESGVVRPVRPTAEPGGRIQGVSARGRARQGGQAVKVKRTRNEKGEKTVGKLWGEAASRGEPY